MSTLNDFYPVATFARKITDTLDFGLNSKTSGTNLDFTLAAPGAPCPLNGQLYANPRGGITVGGEDAKIFDPRNCVIERVDFYDSITFAPQYPPYGQGRGNGSINQWIDTSSCGRIATDVHLLTPIDNTTTITVTVPNHGLPLDLYLGKPIHVFVSTGDYGTYGLLTSRGNYVLNSIVDANTLVLATTLAAWNGQIAQGGPQHMYFAQPILRHVGGADLSNRTLDIHWSFDRNDPTFLESIYSDN